MPVEFVGRSKFAIETLPLLVQRLGAVNESVVIRGETGTGKAVVVAMICERSKAERSRNVTFNCAATPEQVFESELFGYVRGAFTNADEKKLGALGAVGTGTLVLDEIGEAPLQCQQKLLRMFDGFYKPLGTHKEQDLEARILATTNRDLEVMVKEGRFRLDLLHRMQVHVLTIPPLRDRRADILPLLEHFVAKSDHQVIHQVGLEVEVNSSFELANYPWPGNVRELRNAVARALLHRKHRNTVSTQEILAQVVPESPKADHGGREGIVVPIEGASGSMEAVSLAPFSVAELELDAIVRALHHTGNNKTQAAELLGVSLKTIHNKLRENGITEQQVRDYKPPAWLVSSGVSGGVVGSEDQRSLISSLRRTNLELTVQNSRLRRQIEGAPSAAQRVVEG